jgi:hypothetical protein
MKKVLFSYLVSVFLFFTAFQAGAADYTAEEAAKHIGEKATVCGKIIDTLPYQGQTILGMGKGVMEPGAVGIEVADSLKRSLIRSFMWARRSALQAKSTRTPLMAHQ